ncbi:uncharacterized protein BCR38DRAFT_447532 [Pseudomassariella vexata]|uniref:Protein kinase domain-containing protein n=1 Tax=Pseudomassariella vexata TaxID=1141098 RepID=A0A1Y2DGY7_9PEZI|nr:uncharacterized protein BCR38DRAFT_447532 [Pseudomassariella vexata]ORY58518.1 hypothetical protein BCR38DRAFT_447532 [Pseudomassariella vexata]
MSDNEDVVIYRCYCPPGVKRVIASGNSAFIGEVDDSTVLKYPLSPNDDMSRLKAEKKLFEAVGEHERIIKLKGSSAMGLYLERAVKGDLYFQGMLLAHDGTVLVDGCSRETTRYYRPRYDPEDADTKTDIFALGCTIYFIIMGHNVFPDIQDGEEGWREKVEARFTTHQFPDNMHVCAEIAWKCWLGKYESAADLLSDIKSVEAAHAEVH